MVAEPAQDTAEAFFADSQSIDEIEEEAEETETIASFDDVGFDETSQEDTGVESIAEKLSRIRAVVAKQEETSDYDEEDETSGYGNQVEVVASASEEDEQVIEAVEEADETLASVAQSIEDALETDDEASTATETDDEEDDDLDGFLDSLEAGEYRVDTDDDDEDDEDDGENLFDEADDEEDEATLPPSHGRALKVNRAELEAALEEGELEELAEAEHEESSLSAQDEEDLERELAAAEAEAEKEAEADKPAARDSLPAIDESIGEDVSRLMAEADNQMEEPEGRTRRSAFAHLRAAVAARFADRSMDRDSKAEETETQPYRSDLAEVVKPRRPVQAGSKTERPADQRPAPLTLVAEQRVDAEKIKQAGPVAPRRVAAAFDEDLAAGEDTGFKAFADEVGAKELPDLLEAAAAYLSFVEGHEQFSRPQLMSRVRQAEGAEFSREEGLRSFGMLLRTGKIEKIKGGRFAASDEIGFKPDHRAAG
jgi:hypothetical protein